MAELDFGVLLVEEDAGELQRMVIRADETGLHSAWTIEYYNRNSLSRLAIMAASTRRLRVGTAITAAFSRAPLMIATAVADIAAIAPGRIVLGLGSSTRRMNLDWYGVDADHPAPRLEEVVGVVRALWNHAGGPFEFAGRFVDLRFAHLDKDAVHPAVPIYTAGVNERMVRTAGRVADGFVGHPIASVEYLREIALPAIARGKQETTRNGAEVNVTTQVITAIDDDVGAARRWAAMQVAFYSTVKSYEVLFDLHDLHEERDLIRASFRRGDRKAMLDAVSDRMLDSMAVYGTPGSVLEQLDRYRGVAQTVILYPPHFEISADERRRAHYNIIELLEAR